MERRSFLKVCALACSGASVATLMLKGCAPASMVYGDIVGSDLLVPLHYFTNRAEGQAGATQCLVVHNEQLQYPISVCRMEGNSFSALWMKCTHQGTELQIFGDTLICPAHGSEFSSDGTLQQGPAQTNLRTFPVSLDNSLLRISLL